jgi:hypothetical protein
MRVRFSWAAITLTQRMARRNGPAGQGKLTTMQIEELRARRWNCKSKPATHNGEGSPPTTNTTTNGEEVWYVRYAAVILSRFLRKKTGVRSNTAVAKKPVGCILLRFRMPKIKTWCTARGGNRNRGLPFLFIREKYSGALLCVCGHSEFPVRRSLRDDLK